MSGDKAGVELVEVGHVVVFHALEDRAEIGKVKGVIGVVQSVIAGQKIRFTVVNVDVD